MTKYIKRYNAIQRMQQFRHVNLPAEPFDVDKLYRALSILCQRMREKEADKEINFIGFENNWSNCCSGFTMDDGRLHLILSYNIGKHSYSVQGIFDISL